MDYHRINIAYGDEKIVKTFYFIPKDTSWTIEKRIEEFDKAVKELDYIYESFGRFATTTGVCNLFKKYGFERTIP